MILSKKRKNHIMTKIAIAFAFNEEYALPAYIAIKSLLQSKKPTTNYTIFALAHDIDLETKNKLEELAPIVWLPIPNYDMKNFPIGFDSLERYGKLFLPDYINKDKILYSDADVIFKKDLSDIYNMDISGADWAGVIVERNNNQEESPYVCFHENKREYIHSPALMLINANRWRNHRITQRCIETIKKYGRSLLMYETDVLHLATDKILPLPLEYNVSENLYYTEDATLIPEYPYLKSIYTDEELNRAQKNPAVIHYDIEAPKVWQRQESLIPKDYLTLMKQSPFTNNNYYTQEFLPALVSFYMLLRRKLERTYRIAKKFYFHQHLKDRQK